MLHRGLLAGQLGAPYTQACSQDMLHHALKLQWLLCACHHCTGGGAGCHAV